MHEQQIITKDQVLLHGYEKDNRIIPDIEKSLINNGHYSYNSSRNQKINLLLGYANYLFVGAIASLFNLIIFILLLFYISPLIASLTASIIAGGIAFSLNYISTFKWYISRAIFKHLYIYAIIAAITIAIGVITFNILFSYMHTIIAQIIGLACGSIFGYGANRRWNFA